MDLNVFEIFELLPRNNCKNCGKDSCMTFALSLIKGESKTSACAPLREPHYSEVLLELETLLKQK